MRELGEQAEWRGRTDHVLTLRLHLALIGKRCCSSFNMTSIGHVLYELDDILPDLLDRR